jgi:uncharacterized BrkB/YihY/UPF0761 family membrane protein
MTQSRVAPESRTWQHQHTRVPIWKLVRSAGRQWWEDDVFQFAAALAFYTIFSMAPIVSIALWVASIASNFIR